MAGSILEQSLLEFNQFGQLNKSFLLLQIGDIRQYGDSFFVWTYEEITADATSEEIVQQNRIYELQTIDDRMYIIRYFED
jgi:hypothetical protein